MQFIRVFLLFFSVLLPCSSQAIIYKIDKFTKKFDAGIEQTIWVLGDCHEYISDVPEIERDALRTLTTEQRNEIVAIAKELGATVLIEDAIVNSNPANLLTSLPTMITLSINRDIKKYFHQVLTNLTMLCHEKIIDAYSIECRHSSIIARCQPKHLTTCLYKTINRACSIASLACCGFSLLSTGFNVVIKACTAIVQAIAHSIPLESLGLGLMNVNQQLENNYILTKTKKLFDNPHILATVQQYEKEVKIKPNTKIDELLDLKTLCCIKELKHQKNIIICAGSWHTQNLAQYLTLEGYESCPINHCSSRPTPITINAKKDTVTPLAIYKIVTTNITA